MISFTTAPANPYAFELVERKGVGHPDTMCDAIAERASREYSRWCYEKYGRVAHHWFDKVMLMGGEARVGYGEGEIVRPYRVVFAGKAALSVGSDPIPVEELLRGATAETLSSVLTGFDADRHLSVRLEVVDSEGAGRAVSRYRPRDVEDLIPVHGNSRTSNDSNLLSGFAPLSVLERMVLCVERHINGAEFKARHPDTGWDVKVFGRRDGDEYYVLVNMPFLAAHIDSVEHYFARKAEVQAELHDFFQATFGCVPNLVMNATDRNGRAYLTALGSVADTGDVGVVGRGNRVNGLITPMRPMSIEASSGKNPLDHTGKLYGILAQRLADEAHRQLDAPVEVHVFTSKEAPLESPDQVIFRVAGATPTAAQRSRLEDLVHDRLGSMSQLTEELIFDGVTLW